MSVSALMSIGTRAMAANYAQLQTTGNNIANAATPGYSRQSVDLQTTLGQFSGAGYFGKGVDVQTVSRSHSDFLTREAAATRSVSAADDARSDQLQQLERAFGTGEDGIGYAAGQLFNSFVDVATKPQDASARQAVLGAADELTARFRAAGDQIDDLQGGITADLKAAVGQVNSLTARIASLNQQIAAARGTGHTPNDLLDQRDTAIDNLSQYVQVNTVAADDGSMSVFLQGGQRLVLGSNVGTLTAVADPFDPTRLQIGMTEAGITRALPGDYFSGGSIAGLLQVQNHDLVDARNLLGQMASAINGAVNRQQSLGIDLGQPARSGVPLLDVGTPRVAPASDNAAIGGVALASVLDANGNRVPTVSLTVVDASALQPSDYQLEADPSGIAGLYQLTRLSDGQTQSVSDGAVVDGFRVGVTVPAPSAGDRFLLQPVSSAARDFRRVLDDPKGLAAASPVTATAAVDNKGTASIAALSAVSTSINPNLTANISFTDNQGHYSYSLVDSTGAVATTTGTGTWVPGQAISLNGFALELNGVPQGGDQLTVEKTAFPSGDNGNARAMLALRDEALVGQQTLADGTQVAGTTVTDAYADIIANIGVRVQTANSAAAQSAALAADAKTAQTSKAGVNLDEEAARLIQFQQSYQAAAKMLQVAQSIFDSLLQATSR